jgi:hypothetical protein
MSTHDQFEYDVALSFASQDKAIADDLARLLDTKHVKVYLDEYKAGDVWGNDMVNHLANVYGKKAKYCVLLISQHYPLKKWTFAERTSARERTFRDANEYILPLRLDDTDVPGIHETTGYRDIRQHSLESLVELLDEKRTQGKTVSGPPSQSHDLRSGNVPSSKTRFGTVQPPETREVQSPESISQGGLLEAVRAEHLAWEALISEIGLHRMEQTGVTGDWSIKDIVAHLTTWWRREVAVLSAVQRGERPPDHPPDSDVAVINQWIYLTNRDRALVDILREADDAWQHFEDLLQRLPQDVLIDPQRFDWMEGRALGAGKLHDFLHHWHEEHEPLVRRWLEKQEETT